MQSGRGQTSSTKALTARDVQEAIEERISTGAYARGERLPPVRSIAAEFGTSSSTVSRALQEMMRGGWLEVHERQFVRVRRKLAVNTMRRVDLQRTIRSIAHKWKLWGGEEETLVRMIVELVQEVFASRPSLVFAECNAHDLDVMGRRLAESLNGAPLARSLIADLDRRELQRSSAVVLVPYYHYAEVKAIVGQKVPIVPVHTSPSVDTLDKLLTIPAGARVLIVGHNKRSVERLSGMVRDYADGVAITGLAITDAAKVKKLAPSADAMVAVKAAVEALPILSSHKRLIVVEFTIEPSVADRLRPPHGNGAATSHSRIEQAAALER
jgi:DNA-binding transcriptional regulator YhcF (GntR family)